MPINEADVEIVRRIFRECAEGTGTLSIVQDLKRDALLSPSGKRWSISTLLALKRRNGLPNNEALAMRRLDITSARPRWGCLRVDFIALDSLNVLRAVDTARARKGAKGREHDVVAIDLEEIAQCSPGVATPEAVGA